MILVAIGAINALSPNRHQTIVSMLICHQSHIAENCRVEHYTYLTILFTNVYQISPVENESTLKQKCRHFEEIFITDCTESCQNDNFRCSQWLKFHQNDSISVSVNMTKTKGNQLCDTRLSLKWMWLVPQNSTNLFSLTKAVRFTCLAL